MLKNYSGSIYFFGIILLTVSLPLSPFLLSLAQLILLGNWLLEGNFSHKWKVLKSRKSIWAFILIYFIHLIGMLYSDDYSYGFHDLKIKLPLLVLPVIIGTSEAFDHKKFRIVLLFFCGAVVISSILSTGRLFSWWGEPVMDFRDISFIISHIRLALMVNVAIFILFWYTFNIADKLNRFMTLTAGIWLVLFLFLLKSLTGILIFFILSSGLLFWVAWKTKNLMLKWFLAVGVITFVLLAAGYVTNTIARFYFVEKVDVSNLPKETLHGNIYFHNILSKDFENGHYTWLYVCDSELEKEWNKRSKLDYKGLDLKRQELPYTLIRYMTSKGLRKDSVGIWSLTNLDIRNVEMGIANYILTQKFSIYPRIYQLLWEINAYKNGGNPNGHSFTQRFEYTRAAMGIIYENFWIGTGTGDVSSAFENMYIKQKSQLIPRWRLRGHNQLITFLLTFGIIGFLLICFCLLYPLFYEKKQRNFFMVLFLIVAFLSFLDEDTLETQAGISFFVFFYVFFLFSNGNKDIPNCIQ